ncbi:Lipid phosphate phosphatase epsilon 2, chloroplastic [Symbiodinium microadriaticum]|uniref:Lipid phosphate phosphatase epsilon 2, chloroplastic n=1 Tax=Symbiodinium microadriaticum TaxID=2951 RepID=A0A1Q9D3C4_SYMMI|nr:Lipid phosphate phosphatase epsilon 2, chloroplastic [Symbiodinium microadriaticum]
MDFTGSGVPVARARVQLAAGRVPASIRKLDASSKWLVTAGQTAAVVIRHDILSPYIVLGGIAASLFTAKIKRIVNQRRPPGSPLTDPGMPSSHALVATFMSVAWATQVQSGRTSALLLASAILISAGHQLPGGCASDSPIKQRFRSGVACHLRAPHLGSGWRGCDGGDAAVRRLDAAWPGHHQKPHEFRNEGSVCTLHHLQCPLPCEAVSQGPFSQEGGSHVAQYVQLNLQDAYQLQPAQSVR